MTISQLIGLLQVIWLGKKPRDFDFSLYFLPESFFWKTNFRWKLWLMSKWHTSLKHWIISFLGSIGILPPNVYSSFLKRDKPMKENGHALEHLKGSVRRKKEKRISLSFREGKLWTSVGNCHLSGVDGMCDPNVPFDGFRRSVSSPLSFLNGILLDPKAHFSFIDWHSVTHMCVGFICSSYGLPKSRGDWKNLYEMETYCSVVFLWLSNLFSRRLIKWDVKDSQHKYHLLNEAAKVKSVETACSSVSIKPVHGRVRRWGC